MFELENPQKSLKKSSRIKSNQSDKEEGEKFVISSQCVIIPLSRSQG